VNVFDLCGFYGYFPPPIAQSFSQM